MLTKAPIEFLSDTKCQPSKVMELEAQVAKLTSDLDKFGGASRMKAALGSPTMQLLCEAIIVCCRVAIIV